MKCHICKNELDITGRRFNLLLQQTEKGLLDTFEICDACVDANVCCECGKHFEIKKAGLLGGTVIYLPKEGGLYCPECYAKKLKNGSEA